MNNNKRKIFGIARAAKTLLLGGIIAMTCSCNDFLTIVPTDKIVLEDFWKSKTDVENVVLESYRLMAQKDFTYRLLVWGEMRSDNVKEGNNVPYDIKNVLEANLMPSNSYASWAIFYQVINNCNIVLKYAEGVLDEDPNFTQGDLDVVKGEMYALRALCHFYLVRAFRDIPLLTEAKVNDGQELYQKQELPIVVLDQCLADLKLAENLVLTSGNYPIGGTDLVIDDSNNKGRITKDAVRAIIADVLLWKAAFATYEAKGDRTVAQDCYNECIEYCNKILDTRRNFILSKREEDKKYILQNVTLHEKFPIVSLVMDSYEFKSGNSLRFPHAPYDYLFANNCNHFYESIFEIQHIWNEAGNYEVPYFYGCATDDAKATFTPGVLASTSHVAQTRDGGLYKRTDFRRVNNVFSQSEEGKDLDKFGIIKYGHEGASESRSGMSDDKKYEFGKITYKYLDNSDSGGRRFLDQVNWIVYRVSDVMLMKAEALALRNAGDADHNEAFELVEAIYNRSQTYYYEDGIMMGIGDPSVDKFVKPGNNADMLKLVLTERQREFAFEGKRWFDLVRYALNTSVDGKTEVMFNDTKMVEHKYASNPDQYKSKMNTIDHLFFPIAEREIKAANGHLNQNPVYVTEDKYEKN